MRSMKTFVVGLMALLLATGAGFAGSDLNEVGAMLVYPAVIAVAPGQALGSVETFVTITNAGADGITAHVSYINGDEFDAKYCYECDFGIELTGNDTETLSIKYVDSDFDGIPDVTDITNVDTGESLSCNWGFGMIVVTVEDGNGNTLTDNVLLGEEVFINYAQGRAFSIPAVSIQGGSGGDGDRAYELDNNEYGAMPRIVAADFLARATFDVTSSRFLALFTLNFKRQAPPLTDCSITGYDAFEHPFSGSIEFGCWTIQELCDDLSPEFCYPNLGQFDLDTHGWLSLNCEVTPEGSSTSAAGGVHGAIIGLQDANEIVWASQNAMAPVDNVAWGRLLYQSVTTGDPVTLTLEGVAGGLGQ